MADERANDEYMRRWHGPEVSSGWRQRRDLDDPP